VYIDRNQHKFENVCGKNENTFILSVIVAADYVH